MCPVGRIQEKMLRLFWRAVRRLGQIKFARQPFWCAQDLTSNSSTLSLSWYALLMCMSEIYFAAREAHCKCKYAFCLSDERSLIKKIVRTGSRRPVLERRKWSCGSRMHEKEQSARHDLSSLRLLAEYKKRAAISGQNFSSAAFSPFALSADSAILISMPLSLMTYNHWP